MGIQLIMSSWPEKLIQVPFPTWCSFDEKSVPVLEKTAAAADHGQLGWTADVKIQ
jgi:hypothetical protein